MHLTMAYTVVERFNRQTGSFHNYHLYKLCNATAELAWSVHLLHQTALPKTQYQSYLSGNFHVLQDCRIDQSLGSSGPFPN